MQSTIPDIVHDPDRLAALRAYDALRKPSSRALDDITALVRLICSAAAAAIVLIDEERQHFISENGIGLREMGLERSISVHALTASDVLIVPDLAADATFASRRDPRFRYYAGVPLETPEGQRIGVLFVVDTLPRLLSHQQLDALRALSRQVMTQLELRRTLAAQEVAAATLRESEERFRAAFHHALIGMALTDGAGRVLRANRAFEQIVDRTAEELIGRDSYDYTHPDDRPRNRAMVHQVESQELSHTTYEKRYIRKNGDVVWARIHLSPVRDDQGTMTALVAIVEDVTEQRRTRDELVETRRRLDSALIAGEVATYEWEIDSDRVWGDQNFDHIFGVTRDPDGTAPLERFISAIHPDDRALVQEKIGRTVETGCDYEAEYRIITSPAEKWVIARGRITRDERDGTRRFHGVVLDITARKRLEQELERRTRIYDTILSTTDDFAYLIALDGTFLFANRRLLEVWGKTLPEIVGKSLIELGYEQWHADMHLREIAEVIREKHAITGEVPYMAPTGIFGVYEYVFTPVLNAEGEVEVIAGTTRDVTARKRAEDAQRQLAEQLRIALDAANMGWWQYDLQSGRAYWDERLRLLYDVDDEAPDYDRVLERLHPDDQPVVRAAAAAAMNPRDPQPYSVEYRLFRRDGSLRWIASKGRAIFEGDGDERKVTLFVGTAVDITEAKAAETALQASEARYRQLAEENQRLLTSERAARADAERASRMKDEFLATLSHELRTPLSAILGWTQLLTAGGNSAEEIAEGISVIGRNARVQAQIIDDLLEMSRVISGKIRIEVGPVDVVEVIEAAVATVRPAAEAKGVRIETALEPVGEPVTGDANRLQQVFWNLLSNAVKFTPRDGRVSVTLTTMRSQIEVRVSDTGEGIPADFLPYVFDRFRQADASTTRQHSGLGLGLAIVKQVVELHGGVVAASSEGPGRGATFTVTLPAHGAVATAAADADVDERPTPLPIIDATRLAGLRVLVVDDEPDAREVARRIIAACDVHVTTAASAREALEKLEAEPVDVLVSDIGMPHEDGYSLMAKVRERWPQIAGIALTAYARAEDREKTTSSGYALHVAKPAEPAQLLSAIALAAKRA